jgi:glycosyltransferase involved in cell wall biosynthesis
MSVKTVTIAIPAYNEEHFIDRVLHTFSNNDYAGIIEILVGDGGSTDNTKELILKWSLKDRRIQLIHNPEKIQSAALNKMLNVAKGEYFLRADAHTLYPVDYVRRSIEAAVESGAKNTGGAQRFVAENAFQAGIALITNSFLGTGGASYKDPLYRGYADTVYLGCYVTQTLREIGGFSNFPWNEDAELNLRLRKKYGDTVFVDPNIRSWYFPRTSLRSFLKQYYNYGRGRFNTSHKHFPKIDRRGLSPFIGFIFAIVSLISEMFLSGTVWIFFVLVTLLMLIALLESLRLSFFVWNKKKGEIWRSNTRIPGPFTLLPIVFFTLLMSPVMHAAGFATAAIKQTIKKFN